ncbi:MAG: signal peptidase I [Acidobacteriales bacterium]|nr:signal peptidase I [Terriglobales bacterium]
MEFIASTATIFVMGLFIVTFNFQAFEIPSGSMIKTLLIGDHLFVDRTTAAPPAQWMRPVIPYRDIQHGDIIVFISPVQPGLHVVKRILAVPGDRLRLRNGVLFRNGQQVDEPYVIPPSSYDPYRDDFPSLPLEFGGDPAWSRDLANYVKDGELVVPPDMYFGMGDNRGVSYDSRYWGFIPRRNIIGRPMFIYWSFETPEDQYKKTLMSERVGWLVHVVLNFFGDTRWNRTLRLVH